MNETTNQIFYDTLAQAESMGLTLKEFTRLLVAKGHSSDQITIFTEQYKRLYASRKENNK